MKLRLMYEQNNSIIVYKWMAGSNWRVHTREGDMAVGDDIIPLWVGMSLETMPMFFGLVYNNLDVGDEIYLVAIKCNVDDSVTDKQYTTFEYDDTNDHQIGEPAYQLGEDESLIMALGTITSIYMAIPNDTHSAVTLIDRHGDKFAMNI